MFTALAILTILKYKLKILYGYKREKIPVKTIWFVWMFIICTVFGCLLLPTLTVDRKISDKGVKIMNGIFQPFYLVFLSSLSIWLTIELAEKFKLHNELDILKRIIWLEVII
jgi:hypothetical protein